MPASPPQVTYDNGALTIVARNATLGDILREVHSKTGAVMDISGNAAERVVSRFGPGTPHDVLAQLLNGSSFNYVILGSPVDAGKVEKVVLSPKSAGGSEAGGDIAPSPPQTAQVPVQPQPGANDDDDAGDEAQDQPAIKTPEQLLQELQRQQQQLQQQQQQQPGSGEAQPNPRQQ